MQEILEKIVRELIPNSPIQFFNTFEFKGSTYKVHNIPIPILNDLLVRETLLDSAIKSYTALQTIDYRLELYSLCDLVQKTFELEDQDTLQRVNGILAFEITDEGDLKFINTYRKEIRDLTLSKLKNDSLEYLFPYYFVKNRTGLDLDLSFMPVNDYKKLIDFIEKERNEPNLVQLDDQVTIKKP